MALTEDNGPIEVRLGAREISVTCRVVFDDSTSKRVMLHSLSMRGAQREVTHWLDSQGYQPAGRWLTVSSESDSTSVRRFRPHARGLSFTALLSARDRGKNRK